MAKKPLISEEERALFRAAVAQVVPLQADDKITPPPSPPLTPLKPRQDQIEWELPPPTQDYLAPVGAETPLKFARPGLQTKVIQRLHRGEFRREAVLDLHGLNMDQAQRLLHHFLTQAQEQHWHCVQIIHGKGMGSKQPLPLLKNGVNSWLRTYISVLAFCSAKSNDGGTGAVYVLLKTAT